MKKRECTVKATVNGCLMLKMDAMAFMKVVGESLIYEKELILAAKHRYAISSDIYLKQKSHILKSFLKQF